MGYLASLPPVLENERTIIEIPELSLKDTLVFDLDETLFCAKVSDSLSYWQLEPPNFMKHDYIVPHLGEEA